MGPKSQPQTPKDKKKKPEPEVSSDEKLTELEREFFLFQLQDIEKKIARFGDREERIKAETAEIEEKMEEFKKEKGAIVSIHEELLAAKEEEKCNKRNEMFQLSDEIKLRIENHKKSIEELEVQYNKMVIELMTQLEELEEEIRILEDYKQNKVAYNRKLEELEKEMNESEKEHQRNLFRIEKKWENARGRVKKELQSRLLQLSIEFRQTSQKKIGKPCHRVTQENKAIHTAIMEMKEEIHQYNEKEEKSKVRIADLKEHRIRKQEEKDKMIARTIVQVQVIKTLMKKQAALWVKIKVYTALDSTNKMLLKRLHHVDTEIERRAAMIEKVKQDIEGKMESMSMMKDAKRILRKNTRRIQVSIRNALRVCEEAAAVKLIPIGELAEEKALNLDGKLRLYKRRRQSAFDKRGKILQYLYDVLSKSQLTDDDKKLLKTSSESLVLEKPTVSTVYQGGKSTHSVDKEFEEKESTGPYGLGPLQVPDEDKNPFFLSSGTSLPRSISTLVIHPTNLESEESYEGEFEQFEEEEDEEERSKEHDESLEDVNLAEELQKVLQEIVDDDDDDDDDDDGDKAAAGAVTGRDTVVSRPDTMVSRRDTTVSRRDTVAQRRDTVATGDKERMGSQDN